MQLNQKLNTHSGSYFLLKVSRYFENSNYLLHCFCPKSSHFKNPRVSKDIIIYHNFAVLYSRHEKSTPENFCIPMQKSLRNRMKQANKTTKNNSREEWEKKKVCAWSWWRAYFCQISCKNCSRTIHLWKNMTSCNTVTVK